MPYKSIEKRRARCRIYYAKNRDSILERQRKNRKPHLQTKRKYRAKNPGKSSEYSRKWRTENQNYSKLMQLIYYIEKQSDEQWREKKLARDRAYRLKNGIKPRLSGETP